MSTLTQSTQVDDAEFAAFAAGIKKQREEAAQKFSGGGGSGFEYENPTWMSLESDAMKIMRLVSTPFGSGSPNAAVELYTSDIKDDAGKFFRLKLPVREDRPEKDHVLWRMVSKITETVWENKQRVSKYASVYPELYARITKGGYDVNAPQYKYNRGWAGQKVAIFNVIDREDMDWHRKNKHTKLLSKHVNYSTSPDGETREWPNVGVPSYGFVDELARISADYGSWLKYDIGIVKTGQKNSPYRIVNATAFVKGGLKEVPDTKKHFVSTIEQLTGEELEWDTYDLKKLFSPISYTSVLRHFAQTLKEFDAAFHTDYYDEVKTKADAEAAERAAAKATEAPADQKPHDGLVGSVGGTRPVEEAAAPTRTAHRETSVATEALHTKLSVEKISVLKGWNRLSQAQQTLVEDVVLNADGTLKEILWSKDAGACVACPEKGCGIASPAEFPLCIHCNCDFE